MGAGVDTITASQNGGTNYLPAVSVKQVLKVIGKPVFTSPDTASIKGGTAFSYKVVYQIPGNPSMHKDSILSKPSWLNVIGDSLYGSVPKVNRNDTVKIQVSIGNVSNTLVLVLHIKTSTGTLVGMSIVKAHPYKVMVYDLAGRIVFSKELATMNLLKIPTICGIMKVTQNGRTVISKTLRVR
jgi:hypothetical protein